jgi:hypothetical protein
MLYLPSLVENMQTALESIVKMNQQNSFQPRAIQMICEMEHSTETLQ